MNLSKYKRDILQEALELNIGKTPVQIYGFTPAGFSDEVLLAVLYLKAHACSPCNMPVFKRIIPMAAQNENFMVLSHDSNKHFLNPLLKEANFAKVKWINESLYSGESNQLDGELLLIDRLSYVKGFLPVEYLKDEMVFKMFLPDFSDVNF